MAIDSETAKLADAIALALDARERAKPAVVDMKAVEELVKRTAVEAAEAAVTKTLVSLGLDPTDRPALLRDFMFLRDMRTLSSDSKKHVLLALLAFVATGCVGALWLYAKGSGKVP